MEVGQYNVLVSCVVTSLIDFSQGLNLQFTFSIVDTDREKYLQYEAHAFYAQLARLEQRRGNGRSSLPAGSRRRSPVERRRLIILAQCSSTSAARSMA